MAEIFESVGFRTSAFVMGGYTTADFGMDQGFEEFQSHSGTIEQKNGLLIDWLKTLGGQLFFTYMHYVDVDHPYTEPNPSNHQGAPKTLPESADWEAETRRQLEALGYL